MKAVTVVLSVLACGAWLGYALLVGLVADIEGYDGGGEQLAIAVSGVALLGVAGWAASRGGRVAATVAMLGSAACLVWWSELVL